MSTRATVKQMKNIVPASVLALAGLFFNSSFYRPNPLSKTDSCIIDETIRSGKSIVWQYPKDMSRPLGEADLSDQAPTTYSFLTKLTGVALDNAKRSCVDQFGKHSRLKDYSTVLVVGDQAGVQVDWDLQYIDVSKLIPE